MIQFCRSIIVSLCMLDAATAQAPVPVRPLRPVDPDALLYDSRWRELYDQQVELQARITAHQREQYEERQFLEKVNRFAGLWNQLATEYGHKGTFNVKVAKELSKAFRKLESTSAWPRPSGK